MRRTKRSSACVTVKVTHFDPPRRHRRMRPGGRRPGSSRRAAPTAASTAAALHRRRRRVHRAHGRIGGHRAQGHDHQVVIAQLDIGRRAGTRSADAAHRLPSVGDGCEVEVGDLHAELELHALLLQPAHDRPHDRMAAVVSRRLDDLQRRQVGEQAQEAQQVAPQFGGTVPGLEAEHAAPHEPEVGGEECRLEALVDAPGAERLLAAQHEADEVDTVLIGQPEGCSVDDAPLFDKPRLVVPRRLDPEVERILRHRPVGVVERRDVRQQFVHQLVGRAVHAAAAHREARLGGARRVQAAAERLLLEDAHAGAREVAIAQQIDRRRQRGDAAADQERLRAMCRGVHCRFLGLVAGPLSVRRADFAGGWPVFARNSSKASASACVSRCASGTAARAVVKPKPIAPA